MKDNGKTKLWLDREPEGIEGWLLYNDSHQWVVQKATSKLKNQEGKYSGRKYYCKTLDYAMEVYRREREKELGAESLSELKMKLTALEHHMIEIKAELKNVDVDFGENK